MFNFGAIYSIFALLLCMCPINVNTVLNRNLNSYLEIRSHHDLLEK